MKIIFLDIDGVLATRASIRKAFQARTRVPSRLKQMFAQIDCEKSALLRDLVAATGAEIVMSSAWRTMLSKRNRTLLMKNLELPDLLDITPFSELGGNRGEEIKSWLSNFRASVGEIEAFVILDDDVFDLTDLMDHVVQTSMEDGLTPELCGLAKKKLLI